MKLAARALQRQIKQMSKLIQHQEWYSSKGTRRLLSGVVDFRAKSEELAEMVAKQKSLKKSIAAIIEER